jgi:hypothetical protein
MGDEPRKHSKTKQHKKARGGGGGGSGGGGRQGKKGTAHQQSRKDKAKTLLQAASTVLATTGPTSQNSAPSSQGGGGANTPSQIRDGGSAPVSQRVHDTFVGKATTRFEALEAKLEKLAQQGKKKPKTREEDDTETKAGVEAKRLGFVYDELLERSHCDMYEEGNTTTIRWEKEAHPKLNTLIACGRNFGQRLVNHPTVKHRVEAIAATHDQWSEVQETVNKLEVADNFPVSLTFQSGYHPMLEILAVNYLTSGVPSVTYGTMMTSLLYSNKEMSRIPNAELKSYSASTVSPKLIRVFRSIRDHAQTAAVKMMSYDFYGNLATGSYDYDNHLYQVWLLRPEEDKKAEQTTVPCALCRFAHLVKDCSVRIA